MQLLIKTAAGGEAASGIRRVVEADPEIPLGRVTPLEQIVGSSISGLRSTIVSLLLTRFFSGLPFRVKATDLLISAFVGMFLIVVAAAASSFQHGVQAESIRSGRYARTTPLRRRRHNPITGVVRLRDGRFDW